MSNAVLETSEGCVFEGTDGRLYRATFEENIYSLTGADWRVVELDRATEEGGDYSPAVYHDYATDVGRAWRLRNRQTL